MEAKELIARRVAREIAPGSLVNLGIGLPSMVANYLPAELGVFFQAENGVVGLGARPPEGMEDPNLTDAGGGFVSAVPGAASIDSAMSFGLIRGGHLDLTVLGGPAGGCGGPSGQLDGARPDGPRHGRCDGPCLGREEGDRRHAAHAEGPAQDRARMHAALDLDPADRPCRHRNGGDRTDRGGAGVARNRARDRRGRRACRDRGCADRRRGGAADGTRPARDRCERPAPAIRN